MALRIGLALALCAAASTCTLPARAQGAPTGALAAHGDEWRLDGVVVRSDAARGEIWLQAEVQVLQDEASLDGSDSARRIVVDASTRVWTPDGQTRPFSPNALAQALRNKREVTVVGGWRHASSGSEPRARLIILPDLLPANWKPAPLAKRPSPAAKPAAKADARAPKHRAAAEDARERKAQEAARAARAQQERAAQADAALQMQRATREAAASALQARRDAERTQRERTAVLQAARAKEVASRAQRERAAAIQAAKLKEAQARAAASRAQTARLASIRAAQAEEARAQEAREASAAAARAVTTRAAQARADAARAKREREDAARGAARTQDAARLARAQAEAARRQAQRTRIAAEKARILAQRPELSTARASGSSAATEPRSSRVEPRDLASAERAPRDSKPPLQASSLPASASAAAPSAPRVATSAARADGRILLSTRAGAPAGDVASTALRGERATLDGALAAPRDARRESLRAAPPRASRLPSGAAPQAAPAPRSAAADSATRQPLLAMRGPQPTAPARRIEARPSLSEAPLDSGSRLAGAQVLAPTPAASLLNRAAAPQDAVQVLAASERASILARESFAAMRRLQDAIPWPDFNGGPGWDAWMPRPAGAGVATVQQGLGESSKMVALTFDDGPHPNTTRVLDILESYGARGTFFVVGRNVAKDARSAAILREVARRGHEVGSHSMHHFQGVRLSLAQWQAEVDESNAAIAQVLGAAPRLFRAPGCRYTSEALEALRARSMVRVDSSNNSGDWHEPDAAKIVSHVLSRLSPGQVLLFHDPLPQTARALPALLRELRLRGYKCVTVSELARSAAQHTGFSPPVRPPGQGIVLPPEALTARREATQGLEAPANSATLPADAPVLLQVQP